MIKRIIVLAIAISCLLIALPSCSEAAKVNYNLSKQADYFECERRVVVYNARTDTIILEVEGYISLMNNDEQELVITAKVGANEYKKNYVFLSEYVLYTSEDITGTHTDPYHYKWYWHTEPPVSVEPKP